MSGRSPALELVYADPAAFRQEYDADLANGGVFVPTEAGFALRDPVEVRLVLEWCHREVAISGEVVHIVEPGMSQLGGKPGVAVQFREPAADVRERLAPFTFEEAPAHRSASRDTRHAPRKPARVPARIDWSGGRLTGCTRNISRSGVLVGVEEGEVPRGESVVVTLRHPVSHVEFAMHGRVARQVMGDGRVSALGIEFDAGESSRAGAEQFLDELMGTEHTKRLGAISGPIAELGPHNIVQMLAASAPRGTIVLRRGEEEGLLCFEGGLLLTVRLGAVSGMEALVRVLAWRDGTFEFTSSVEERSRQAPMPLDAAILEAVRQTDEESRPDARGFPLQARLVRSDPGAERDEDRSVIEEALLDLASAGFTVSRALEVIPEPDHQIFRAMQTLIDAKELELR